MKILIIAALQQEAKPIITELDLIETTPFDDVLPMRIFTNNSNPQITLVISGADLQHHVENVGTQAAAISALMAIKTFNPDLVINIGTAGGFKEKGAEIGDVYIATQAFYHHRRIPLPKYKAYGMGGYLCDTMPEITDKLNVKKGILSTGDSLDAQPCDLEIMKKHNAVIKDMEGASIVWVANLYKKPVLVMKSVTDFVDYPEENFQDFIKNLNLASHNLKDQVLQILSLLK
jgi:5'-methylthioadenosine nucleosidase